MYPVLTLLLLIVNVVFSWNTCSDEYFCNRIRNEGITSSLVLNEASISFDAYTLDATLSNDEDNRTFTLAISAIEGGIFRIIIDDPQLPRHRVSEALRSDLVPAPISVSNTSGNNTIISSGDSEMWIEYSQFKISVYKNNELVLLVNEQNKITYNSEEDDLSVALDFTFLGATTAYGIPEHAERLSLQTTGPGGLNPYRLYNVDNPAYPIGTQEALYGAVPVLYGHGVNGTTGVFWLNSAQTFVDINRGNEQVESLFVSESGAIDLFILTGPTMEASVKQYVSLTGTAPLPQYYTLGHHQSRWSYLTQEDAETVVREFDNHDLPLDVIWFDIDYTYGMRYFTWNYTAFPDPVGMQEFINSTGRKPVLIIDPHYKVDEDYFVYVTAAANDYFVKNPNGTDYQADCWPGLSSWIDFLKPEAADYYSSLYGMDNFTDATDIVQIWNDMNEPAVFDVFEKTMPRDVVHNGTILHRDVHNVYGLTQTIATHKGLLDRYSNTKRPFTLTRAHFSGTQRYSAIWTGDNYASWEHLRISFPMCLTQAISGISFCGADVGGFSGEVTEELFQRWYQAGAWLPFYRAHADSSTARREPYLFREEVLNRFRNALRQRYYYLPKWYTLFYEHERYGNPVIAPLAYQYPSDSNTLNMDNQWLVGQDILVHPVATEGATEALVYFPGGERELWFDIENNLLYLGLGFARIPVTMDTVPVFHRGGSILARKEIHRASSAFTHSDPYTIYVFLNLDNQANGTLYIDDNESFNYRNNEYNYIRLEHNGSLLTLSLIDEDASYAQGSFIIQTIWVYRPPANYKKVVVNNKEYPVTYGENKFYLKLDNLDLTVRTAVSISFE